MIEQNQEPISRSREIVQLDAKFLAGAAAGIAISSALLTYGNEEAKIVGAALFVLTSTSPLTLRLANARFYRRQTVGADNREDTS